MNHLIDAIGWTIIHSLWQCTAVALILALVLHFRRPNHVQFDYAAGCVAMGVSFSLFLGTFALMFGSKPEVAAIISAHAEPIGTGVDHPAIKQFLPWIASIYLMAVVLRALWLFIGWMQMQQVSRKASPAPIGLQEAMGRLAERLDLARLPRLLQSSAFASPVTFNFVRTVIVLPTSLVAGCAPEMLEALIAHELAHIRRYDYLMNLVQTVIETVMVFHPAIHWMSNMVRERREHCCDDLAVRAVGDTVTYVKALYDLASTPHRSVSLAANGGDLVRRVRRLAGVCVGPNGAPNGWSLAPIATLAIIGSVNTTPALNLQSPVGEIRSVVEHLGIVSPQTPSQRSIRPNVKATRIQPRPAKTTYDSFQKATITASNSPVTLTSASDDAIAEQQEAIAVQQEALREAEEAKREALLEAKQAQREAWKEAREKQKEWAEEQKAERFGRMVSKSVSTGLDKKNFSELDKKIQAEIEAGLKSGHLENLGGMISKTVDLGIKNAHLDHLPIVIPDVAQIGLKSGAHVKAVQVNGDQVNTVVSCGDGSEIAVISNGPNVVRAVVRSPNGSEVAWKANGAHVTKASRPPKPPTPKPAHLPKLGPRTVPRIKPIPKAPSRPDSPKPAEEDSGAE